MRTMIKSTCCAIFLLALSIPFGQGSSHGFVSVAQGAVKTVTARRGAVLTATDSARALTELSDEIASLIKLPEEVGAGHVGVYVRSLSTGKMIYQLNSDKPLTPASTTKVV